MGTSSSVANSGVGAAPSPTAGFSEGQYIHHATPPDSVQEQEPDHTGRAEEWLAHFLYIDTYCASLGRATDAAWGISWPGATR